MSKNRCEQKYTQALDNIVRLIRGHKFEEGGRENFQSSRDARRAKKWEKVFQRYYDDFGLYLIGKKK